MYDTNTIVEDSGGGYVKKLLKTQADAKNVRAPSRAKLFIILSFATAVRAS